MKKRILITRKVEDEFVKTLENRGYEVFVEPIFDVEKLPPELVLEKISREVCAIITSSNAIASFLSADAPKNSVIFALSKRIADELMKFGYHEVLYPQEANAKALEELILSRISLIKNREIYYFCGNFVTSDFAQILARQGLKAQNILSYKVTYHQNFSSEFLQKNQEKIFDFVFCYSKNAAKNLAFLLQKNKLLEYFKSAKIIALSQKIADKLVDLGFEKIVLIDEFNKKIYGS